YSVTQEAMMLSAVTDVTFTVTVSDLNRLIVAPPGRKLNACVFAAPAPCVAGTDTRIPRFWSCVLSGRVQTHENSAADVSSVPHISSTGAPPLLKLATLSESFEFAVRASAKVPPVVLALLAVVRT